MSDFLDINSWTGTGRAGADPDVRYFESGSVKAELRIAVDQPKRNGVKQDPFWFRLEAWGKTAEIAANHVRKGDMIGVSGRVKFEEWQDKKTGEPRKGFSIVVQDLALLGKARSSQPQESPPPDSDYDYY